MGIKEGRTEGREEGHQGRTEKKDTKEGRDTTFHQIVLGNNWESAPEPLRLKSDFLEHPALNYACCSNVSND